MHVGFDHEGVNAHVQRRVGTFFYQSMPGADHFDINSFQDFRGKEAQVVLEGLQFVAVAVVLRPAGMAEH